MPRLSKIGAACLSAFGFGTGASGVTADYLVVAGGGGGGSVSGAGGGAGGLQTGTTTLSLSSSYTVIVGGGGVGGINRNTRGTSGSNSQFGSLTASVGGGGAGSGGGSSSTVASGLTGGSGGGSSYYNTGTLFSGTAGTATSGQGYAGGTGSPSASGFGGGGGGGAGAVGSNGTSTSGGAGGIGISSSITGTATYYAGGGGAGVELTGNTLGAGGNGGGANGTNSSTVPSPATANLGGGGGGSGYTSGDAAGSQGGSGVVVVRYLGAQKFGGGIVSSDGTYTIHTFKTSGQLVPMTPVTASYLIVAGGGGGGSTTGGGGGAGGLLTGSTLSIDTSSTYIVTVGAGGNGGTSRGAGSNGTNSSFSLVTAALGGGGGGGDGSSWLPLSGGSGGGGGWNVAGAAGTSGQGYAGGTGANGPTYYNAAGGGGAGAVGATSSGTTAAAGAGGIGVSSSITGTATYYAGGGGGGADNYRGGTGGAGGLGGGAAGGTSGVGANAVSNLGGGGGGACDSPSGFAGGNGGSGIVVIAYAGSTQLMAGGTVTIVGGNVIHTFTSSGYLTPLTFVGRSLRFRSSVSASISRTPVTAGNQKTWTFSAWVKRGQLTRLQKMFEFGSSTSNYITMLWNGAGGGAGADQLDIYANSGGAMAAYLDTVALYRDPAAWYHIVFAVDTTQATASNRLKLYVNGSQITSFASASYPTQNADLFANSAVLHRIGNSSTGGTGQEFDGYMADIRLIDGQQLSPNSFGTFNSYGVWQPINYGGSYGNNGFYLPFNNSSASSYAGSFNGSNKYLSTTATGFNASTGTWTVEGWAYCTSSTNDDSLLVGQTSGTDRFYLAYSGSTLYLGDVTSNIVVASNAKPLNQWFHWAVVKSGSTYTVYINGSSVGSSTTALSNYSLTTWLIGARPSAPNYLNGYMSNVRVNTTTAVYTSNFTPVASPLTAISGTQLLTLQNSTITDNSTNAFSITNNGSVTTSVQYPFSTEVFKDQGPQGNHWTPNNISLLNGSTYDSMTDVPTLTSATAANYCVLNPLQNTGSITDGNLKFTGYNQQCGVSMAAVSGKHYWEGTFVRAYGGGFYGYFGITGFNDGNLFSANGAGLYATTDAGNGGLWVANSRVTTYTTYAVGDVIGFAYDAAASTLAIYRNNVQIGSTLSVPANGKIFTLGQNGTSGDVGITTWNFGQQPFAYTPPSGFVALNTYNL